MVAGHGADPVGPRTGPVSQRLAEPHGFSRGRRTGAVNFSVCSAWGRRLGFWHVKRSIHSAHY